MDIPEREDYLEAVLICMLALQRKPTAGDVAIQLKGSPGTGNIDPRELVNSGDIIQYPDGSMELTEHGRSVAERVLKKHRVLQCFFREMLGMDDQIASDEACVLEHNVSDHTIRRLGRYIGVSGDESTSGPEINPKMDSESRIRARKDQGQLFPVSGGNTTTGSADTPTETGPGLERPGDKNPGSVHTLSEMAESDILLVAGISPGSDIHRLIDLGVIPGEEILMRRKLKNQAVVIRVKGCDIALSPEIAGTILVEKKV